MKLIFTLIIGFFAAAILPLVSAQSDLEGCITSIVTNTIKGGDHGTIIDAAQCIVNGTIGKCQFQCMTDVNACMPERDPQCLNIEFQQCVNTCIDNPNFLTTGCFDTALDFLAFVPELGVIVSFYQIFTSCINTSVGTLGFDRVVDVITSVATELGVVLEQICQTTQNFLPLECGTLSHMHKSYLILLILSYVLSYFIWTL